MKNKLRKITAEIPEEWGKIKDENRWTWVEIIGLGIKSKENNPPIIRRLNELEKKEERNTMRRVELFSKIKEIEGKVNEIKKDIKK